MFCGGISAELPLCDSLRNQMVSQRHSKWGILERVASRALFLTTGHRYVNCYDTRKEDFGLKAPFILISLPEC